MSTEESKYREEVKRAIERTIVAKGKSLEDVIINLSSPDPGFLQTLYKELQKERPELFTDKSQTEEGANRYKARRLSASLPLSLPAPDPESSQWWFTLDTIDSITDIIYTLSAMQTVVFLGAPTAGYHYANKFPENKLFILDRDVDVCESLGVLANATVRQYDVAYQVPEDMKGKSRVVFMDPPWYQTLFYQFTCRSRELLADDGYILVVLPSRQTRSGVVRERTELLKKLIEGSFEIVSIETNVIDYAVPQFENVVMKKRFGYSGRKWRKGDLLTLEVNEKSVLEVGKGTPPKKILTFFRKNEQTKFRVFLEEGKEDGDQEEYVKKLDNYEISISTREVDIGKLAL